jgi:hypothetical protein
VSDAAKIQELVRLAWDEARSIDMGHLGEQDRVLVCETIVDLIEGISPSLKTRTGRRPYIVIVRDHRQLRIELREPEGWLHAKPPASVFAPDGGRVAGRSALRPAARPPRRR